MGEQEFALKPLVEAVERALDEAAAFGEDGDMRVSTPGGVFHVRWDDRGGATAMGQLPFFAEYLNATGLFEDWVKGCPLSYVSPNAPRLVDVLGTWMLSILDGHHRYAHVGMLRGDGVAPSILGMKKIIGDDSLRRALSAIAPAPHKKHTAEEKAAQEAQVERATQWMQGQLMHSVAEALKTAWILDCDTTIKPLYGHQAGAELGYNPHKPGRPSHAIHTYWIGNLRLVLDAQLDSGKRHAPSHSRPGLVALLEGLAVDSRPELVRGDVAFGSEGEMAALEALKQPYLFKLRQSPGVMKLLNRQWNLDEWVDVGQGWTGREDTLRLMGWSKLRRVIVIRRPRKMDIDAQGKAKVKKRGRKSNVHKQAELALIDQNEATKNWEYAVLVCDTPYKLENMGQLYRDRADCENGFDEIKNQWGWGGYSTHDIERCALSARAVALIYNWWSWYVRLA
ncbi:MAG: transposase, partial [Burkholderiales bacterium]